MPDRKQSKWKRLTHIRDARGRKVTQLDPIALHLLRQHHVIEADVLRAIANEKGVRITKKERASLIFGIIAILVIASFFIRSLIVETFGAAPYARTSAIVYLTLAPWAVWIGMKRSRFGKVAAAMLKHLRCPSCGYDLRLLPTDPEDGATICPECGSAWKLDEPPATDHDHE